MEERHLIDLVSQILNGVRQALLLVMRTHAYCVVLETGGRECVRCLRHARAILRHEQLLDLADGLDGPFQIRDELVLDLAQVQRFQVSALIELESLEQRLESKLLQCAFVALIVLHPPFVVLRNHVAFCVGKLGLLLAMRKSQLTRHEQLAL